MRSVSVTLLTKPGCHLCDQAREVVVSVLGDVAAAAGAPSVALEERSILDDPALLEKYSEDIPVVLIDGRVHNIWRVDPVRLRAALLEV